MPNAPIQRVRPVADPLELSRLSVVLITVIANIVVTTVLPYMPWSQVESGAGLALLNEALLIIYAVRARDRLAGHLLLFGLLVGAARLPTDFWLVDFTHTLRYSAGGAVLARTPLWVPLAWQVVAVQFACIGLSLAYRGGLWGFLLAGIVGLINIAFYEQNAVRAGLWSYVNCHTFLLSPHFVIVANLIFVVSLVAFARMLVQPRLGRTVLAGALSGLGLLVGNVLAHLVVEGVFLRG